MTSRGSLYTVCNVWGDTSPILARKIPYFIQRMEEEMALFKSLVPSRDEAEARVRPEKEMECSGFADCVIADR